MYISSASDLAEPGIPPHIDQLVRLMGCRFYICLPDYETSPEDMELWRDASKEDIDEQVRQLLLYDLYRSSEMLFRNPVTI